MSKALALTGGNIPKALQKQLAQAALEESGREASSGGRFISAKGGKFSFQGNKLPNPMQVVVADYISVNTYYDPDRPYDEDKPASPICWAIGKDERMLAPAPASPDKQAATCAECKWNAFKSAENGKGKACKNTRRVAVFPLDAIKAGEHAVVKIAPASLTNWRKYIDQLTKVVNVPTYSVVTEITLDDKIIEVGLVKLLPAKTIAQVSQLRASVQSDLLADFTPSAEEPAKAGGRKRVKVKVKVKNGGKKSKKGGF